MFIVLPAFDKDGSHMFKSLGSTDFDRQKYLQWRFDHQKGREFTKKSFGEIHYEWDSVNPDELPVADFPSSSNPFGIFSCKAVDALRDLLEKFGDLHPIIMTTGEAYFLYDCWSFVDYEYATPVNASAGTLIRCIDLDGSLVLPEVFCGSKWPGLIVAEQFKQTAEDAGLTGMVFAPIQINRIKDEI